MRAALPLAPERATPYVHRRVAVYGALPRTLIAARQCTARRQVRIINVFQPPKRLDGVLPHAGLSPEELQELPLAMHAQLPGAPRPIGVDIRLFGGSCGLTPRRIASQQRTQVPTLQPAIHVKTHSGASLSRKDAFCMRAVAQSAPFREGPRAECAFP